MFNRNQVYTKDIDGGVQILSIDDGSVLMELSLAAAEDLAVYLKISAETGRIKASPDYLA